MSIDRMLKHSAIEFFILLLAFFSIKFFRFKKKNIFVISKKYYYEK